MISAPNQGPNTQDVLRIHMGSKSGLLTETFMTELADERSEQDKVKVSKEA